MHHQAQVHMVVHWSQVARQKHHKTYSKRQKLDQKVAAQKKHLGQTYLDH
jgi:hypothetical protein